MNWQRCLKMFAAEVGRRYRLARTEPRAQSRSATPGIRGTRQGRLLALLACAALASAHGCGRPTRPGEYFEGKRVETNVAPPSTTPLPEKPYLELGSAEAKVRILVFFPIDEPHNDVINLFKELVSRYEGKVYVKYVDPRTSEGRVTMERSHMTSYGMLINGASEMTIKAEPQPYRVEFLQDLGRYWTAEDLRAAVAQTVTEMYGGGASAKQ